MKHLVSLAAAAVIWSRTVKADVTDFCPQNADSSVCYSVGVPSSSASSGSGNIYFQITASTDYQWVALGTGSRMSGSNMFIMYQDGSGNLTLSPRLGTFHTPPQLDTSSDAANLTLLSGSGVSSDGKTMTANVMCSNCESWSNGGSLSLTSTSSNWIGAWRSGDSLSTTDKSESISQHDETTQFNLDLTQATIDSDVNPFVTSGSSGNGTGSGSGSGSGSGTGSGSGSGSGSDSGSGGSGVSVVAGPNKKILAAHGVIMALVMVILYPLGSLLMPLIGKWFVHAGWQTVAFLLMWAGFGLGVRAALDRDMIFKQAHTIFGTVIVCLLVIQPVIGLLHHNHYAKHQSRGPFSLAHIWWGRLMIILGIINGGLGLQLADASNSLIIAYSIVSAVIFLGYAIVGTLVSIRKKTRANGGYKRSKEPNSPVTNGDAVPMESYKDRRPYVERQERS